MTFVFDTSAPPPVTHIIVNISAICELSACLSVVELAADSDETDNQADRQTDK